MYRQQGSFHSQIQDPKPSETAAKLAERQASASELHSSNKPSKEDCRTNKQKKLDFNLVQQPTTGEGELMKAENECWIECLLSIFQTDTSESQHGT